MMRLACAVLGLLTAAGAQDPPTAEPATLIARLRDTRLGDAQRDEVVRALLALGEKGATALLLHTRSAFRSGHGAWQGDERRFLDAFTKAAPRALSAQQGKDGARHIENLRSQILEVSRNAALTKEMITDRIDPLLPELDRLVVLSAEAILQSRKPLEESYARLQEEIHRLQALRGWHEQAVAALRETPMAAELDRQPPLPAVDQAAAELEREMRWRAHLAMPMSAADARTLNRNRELAGELDAEEYAGILEINLLRIRLGLRALAIDVKLCTAARGHSDDMRRLNFFSHTSPVPGKETPGKRAALAGTSGGAENIAAGPSEGFGAVRMWWYSPGHHQNMLGSHGRAGLGRSEQLWTLMLGG